ncbi:MAG: fasciclin domain-containing protein, partial [Bacteroidia bacterium]|nr:fasciclin domain-containing protein [Bacteroidia bacterium]
MNIISKISKIVPIIMLAFIFLACSNDDDNTPAPMQSNIVELASATADLSSLVAALQAADGDLVSVLSGAGPFTVLAPSNAAFQALLDSNPAWNTIADIDTAVLSQVLLNHVISGSVTSSDLTAGGAGYARTNASGAGGANLSIFYDTSNGVRFNNVSSVTTPDVEASNGVVHLVDAVIGLPNIVDHALANPDLSELVGALTAGGNTTFTDLLSTAGDFTVFAPVNSAFTGFTNPNGNDINDILSNHVIVGASALSTGLSNAYLNTAATNGDGDALSIYINTDDGVSLNGTSNVAAADIVATNGIIHAVDAVIDLPSVVTFATADPTFGTLVTALTRADLTFDYVTTLSSEGPFTVFAPINEAFTDLLTELGVESLGDIGEPTLKATLDHHAVAGLNVRAEDLTDAFTVPTLGGDITANVTGGATLTDANDRVSNIIATNVQAINGVIHA